MNNLVLLLASTVAGIVFGFVIASLFSRADRSNLYSRGKSDGESERVQLQERLALAQERIEELRKERAALKEAAAPAQPPQPAIEELIEPLRECLAGLEAQRAAAHQDLAQQVAQLRHETSGIFNTLRVPAAAGVWGELQLRRVVELAGMAEHCDFEQQPGEGLIISLPGERTVGVDATISVQSCLEALQSTDGELRQAKLGECKAQLRDQVSRLASRRSQPAPEFVVAFLPAESHLGAALSADPELIEFSAAEGVILATPATLIALLRTVASVWRQNRLAEEAERIRELGQALHDRLIPFTAHFDDLRRSLVRTVDTYNKTAGWLESRVLVTARQLKELGAAGAAPIEFLEPVDAVPRGLQALDQSVQAEVRPEVKL